MGRAGQPPITTWEANIRHIVFFSDHEVNLSELNKVSVSILNVNTNTLEFDPLDKISSSKYIFDTKWCGASRTCPVSTTNWNQT
jgi:hypothetical protein